MSQDLAFLNGQFVPATEAHISFIDAGFVQGTTVAEQLRTFRGHLFELDGHLERLASSLEIVGVQPPFTLNELSDAAQELVNHNWALLDPGDDLGLCMFVTPGVYPTFGASDAQPTVGMHTYPLPFHLWAQQYRTGQKLVIAKTRQVLPQNWPSHLKCRSRMHYYLADREARSIDPEARALLLDSAGNISETTTSNLVAIFGVGQFTSPLLDRILPGISLRFVHQLVTKPTNQRGGQNISWTHSRQPKSWEHRAITIEELGAASELLLTATSSCLLPVAAIDGRPVDSSVPGPSFRQLISAWSDQVGLDINDQAEHFAPVRRNA